MLNKEKNVEPTSESGNDAKPIVSGSAVADYEYYADGQPCKGRACWAHKTKPCEYCGRVACQGEAKIPKPIDWHFR